MFKNLIVLSALTVLLTACGTDVKAPPTPQTPDVNPDPQSKIKVHYEVLTPEEAFAKDFSSVKIYCEVLDGGTMVFQSGMNVFPNMDGASALTFTLPKKNVNVTLKLEQPILGTWDFKVFDQTAGQIPMLKFIGSLKAEAAQSISESIFTGTIVPASTDYQDLTGELNLESDKPEERALVRLRCKPSTVPKK